jgi:class 3 adenylate cyclase
MSLPTGVVTFLFTDIEGSTPLFQQHPQAMPSALARHHALLHEAIADDDGHVFQVIGDAFCAAFAQAANALAAALAAQRALLAEPWGETGPLRVRMGLHTGPAEAQGDDYQSGMTLIRAQRFMAAGHGGQILLSPAVVEGLDGLLPPGVVLRDLGVLRLRGLVQAERIYQVIAPGLPAEFPPLRGSKETEAGDLFGQLVQGRLVGRSTELEQLHRHWRLAQQGRGHLALLSGEPGVGKTRLAQELIAVAQSEGAAILRGGCYEYEAATPYLPFVEAFRDWVHLQSAEGLRSRLGLIAAEIAKLAPEVETKVGPLTPGPRLGANEERLRLFDAVARLLQQLAAASGLLLFIDDLHWADQGTINLLHYLLRRLRHERVLLLTCYREVELDRANPLAPALVEWNRERLATRLPLGRLGRAATASLLATLFRQETISAEFVEVIQRETEGNPFFIEEVIKALIEQGQIYLQDGRWERKAIHDLAIPQSVKEAVGRRLSRLSQPCLEVLHTAAAMGKQFRFDELVAVGALSEDATLDALDEACLAQLLRAEPGDAFLFTHDKIREVLYEELNPIRRRRLHRRVGESLEQMYAAQLPEHAHDLAYHFSQSGEMEKAFRYSLQAATNARRVFAHDEALAFLRQAHEAAEESGNTERLASVDAEMGRLYQSRGLVQPAAEALTKALAGTADAATRTRLKVLIGEVYATVGDPRGLAYLHEARAEIDAVTQPNEMALTLAHLGRYHHFRAEHTESIRYLEQARQLAEPLDRMRTLFYVYLFLAGAYQHLTRFEESNHWARATIALGERKHNALPVAVGHEFLAENATLQGHWDAAIEHAAQDQAIGERTGAFDRTAWALFVAANALWGQGRLSEAEERARAGLELADQIGEGRLATWLEPLLALILADRGDDEDARRHAEGGLRRAETLGQMLLLVWSRHALGYGCIQRRAWPEAVANYQQAIDLWQPSENRSGALTAAPAAAEAFLGAGRRAEARDLIGQAQQMAAFAQAPYANAQAQRVQGQLAAQEARWEEAEAAFAAAILAFTQLQSQLDLGRALLGRAQMWTARGEDEQARADAERARSLFAATGARHDLERLAGRQP